MCKENIIPGFFFQFEPAMTFSTSFPSDAITLRICLSILLLFWCICKERNGSKLTKRNHTFPTTIVLNMHLSTLLF